ncbi:hypothetical protein BpHYR1_034327 [Brachionus plicatilis]|uniref:Uncharacterized protein n=1 Tax=Brachionus plicatilis TaxID=10195 RepID=A0A3M7RVH8_BRAPC|nr:hypothetical protein BpHYR1_034327 [Brachionus plicatilis]
MYLIFRTNQEYIHLLENISIHGKNCRFEKWIYVTFFLNFFYICKLLKEIFNFSNKLCVHF